MCRRGRDAVKPQPTAQVWQPTSRTNITTVEVPPEEQGDYLHIGLPSLGNLYQEDESPQCLAVKTSEVAIKNSEVVNFLVVQCLGLGTFTDKAWVLSLVKELRSHNVHGAAKKRK